MKQYGIGFLVGAAVVAMGGYFVLASPRLAADTSARATQIGAKGARVPRGSGFDFYVLALSWSPTYCQGRGNERRDAIQCAGPRPFAFVVHGLWPQFERGYPRSCRTSRQRPSQNEMRAMLDIMPSQSLVNHQWDAHGTCSGLSGSDYLKVVRAASGVVKIPADYASAHDWRRVSAGEVEAAFIANNPGLQSGGIAVARRGNLLSEVRVCLTLDLAPRPCPEVDRTGARDDTRLSLPPSRG